MSITNEAPERSAATIVRRVEWGALTRKYLIVLILIGLVVVSTILTDGSFIKPQNLINVIRQVSAIGIIACGMTFVIITLGIDLSVGSIVGMSAVVGASLAQTSTA
ncbi:MAG TPA: hypothetical protein PKB06_12025, partial [Actinotalea sp.]|nr:hypothetical protein [Actinotalea sp.]